MTDTADTPEQTQDGEKTYTQADFDELEKKHQEELEAFRERIKHEYTRKAENQIKEARQKLEDEIKQAGMSEQEKLQSELEKTKKALAEKEDVIAISGQKDETRAYLKEIGVEESNLDFVFVPRDMESTKNKANAFKEMIDSVKKNTFETNLSSTIPKMGKEPVTTNDVFLQGFNNK